MRNKGWLAIALVLALPAAVFTASCSKNVVQSQTMSQPVSKAGPDVPKADVPKADVQKAPGATPEKPVQAARPEDDRRRAETAAREAAKWVFLNEHIHFAFNSSLLSDEARRILHGKAEYLRANPQVMVTVEGHCDERGTNAFNVALGERRADSVKTYLVDLGVGTIRLTTMSYGKERPVAAGHDEESWARNRRAQIVIN